MTERAGRRRLLFGLGAALCAAAARAAPGASGFDTAFPQRPIRLVVPWPAGGSTDLTLRVLADVAGQRLGQRVYIDNRGGASGTLAMPVLRDAAPDGYTIAQLPYPVLRIPHLRRVNWHPICDVTPILQISGYTFGLVVPQASPFYSLEDLVAFAQAHPGELMIGTNGIGTTPHLVLEEIFTERGLTYTHVPYKGTAEQMLAVASQQLSAGANSTGFAPYVERGDLRLLVTFGAMRSPRWPQVPTLRDLGYPIAAASPYGLAGPRGLPPAVLDSLHQAFRDAAFSDAHVAELDRYELELDYLDPDAYAAANRIAFAREKLAAERLGLSHQTV
jgi:tripartite-type tricarboxylate transporter receptor subunit TctC